MPLSAGDKVGPYEILAHIGAGGMGEVWKARDTRLDRIVAIKTPAEKFNARFEGEARAVAALNHPHICQLYDVGPDYLVMEYVEGSEIKGPLPIEQALKAAIQLAGAMDAAHRRSITHRDLKPANILMTKSGVKVLDFGLAKWEPAPTTAGEASTRALTEEGVVLGTVPYMAPEQLQGKPADARSDIFSFGCVLYEMLTGKRAFQADNKASLIAAIMDREPEPFQPTAQPTLDRTLKKCLAKDPDDRWQSASDLKSELEWILAGGSAGAVPVTPHRSARTGWIVAAVLGALLAAFAIFHYRTAPAPAAVMRFEVPPPDGASWGETDFPAISPDGSRILFAATNRDGTRRLWMRPLDAVIAQPVSGTEGTVVTGAAWSPDGGSIAYVGEYQLRKLELAGGVSRVLTPVPAWIVPAWGSGGVILFTGRERPWGLYQIPAAGGEAVAAMGSGAAQYFPSFLPDGRTFLYTVYAPSGTEAGDQVGLYSATLNGKQGKRVAAGSSAVFAAPNWLLYVRGSTLVAHQFDTGAQALTGDPIPVAEQVATIGPGGGGFSVSRNGVLAYRRAIPPPINDLTWYDRSGNRLGTVGEQAVYSNPALSPDGKRLAISRLDPAANARDIWVLNLERGVSSRFTFDKGDDTNPVWSPDGSRIAFSAARKGPNLRDIYWKAAGGGGNDEPVLETAESKSLDDWSADGKLLLYNVTGDEMDAVAVSGDRKPFPVLKGSFRPDHGRLSPDGHWIAYVSRESGRNEIFVQNFPPAGGKWQISTSGGDEPYWRADGRELFFLNGTKLEAADIKAAGNSFEAGLPKELFDTSAVSNVARRNHYVATANGQRFLFVTAPKMVDTVPFVVLSNWQAALKR